MHPEKPTPGGLPRLAFRRGPPKVTLSSVSCPLRQLPLPVLLAAMVLLCQCAAPPRPPATPALSPGQASRWTRVTDALAATAPVDRRGKAIAWRFSVREVPGINARSWPDGRVEVNAGTLSFARNDGELAAVLAHEMAHVTGRHHHRQLAEGWSNLLAGAALAAILAHEGTDDAGALAFAGSAVLTVNVTALAARRRDREFEADRLSMELLRKAGYPASAAGDFWERYAAVRRTQGRSGGRWWQSHPADAERVRRLRTMAASR
jgi:predicted Zn-dependent protease